MRRYRADVTGRVTGRIVVILKVTLLKLMSYENSFFFYFEVHVHLAFSFVTCLSNQKVSIVS